MQQSGNVLDKWANRVLFLRHLGWGLLFVGLLVLVVLFSYSVWRAIRADVFEFPSYNDLDSLSLSYWSDRVERDIAYVGEMKISDLRKAARLRVLVNRQLGVATDLSSHYERNHAILAIALTLTKHNLDVNIDKTLRIMNDSYEAYSIRARIHISVALMQIRKKNLMSAMSAYSEYWRLLNHADLKLDTPENEESFIGAVTILHLAQNIEELSELFRVHIELARRINSGQRMKAYRLIAVEQARSGSFLQNSFSTLKMIHDVVEFSRAVQLVVTFVARPPKIDPIEPVYPVPRSDGPWETIRSTLVVRNTIDSILQVIIKEVPNLDEQLTFLRRISGSILMCDPDVYKIFRAAVFETPNLDDVVKIPVLRLLDNPISDKIRSELKLPPRPKKRNKNGEGIQIIDPARHDWVNDNDMIDVQLTAIDTDTLKSIDIRQYSRILSVIASLYLQVNRTADATTVIKKAFNTAINQPDQTEQIRSLTTIAGLQLDAGTIDDALKTLTMLSQKLTALNQTNNNDPDNNTDSTAGGFVDEQLLSVVELQAVGRYFDDAIKNVQNIKSASLRDSGFLLIANELLRTNQLANAAKVIALISDTTTKNEYQHRLTIAKAESNIIFQTTVSIELPEESLNAIGIIDPATTTDDENIAISVRQLIRFGFFESAVITAKRIKDAGLQAKLLAQIGREYVLIFSAYSHQNNNNQQINEPALGNALFVAEIIPDTEQRTIFTLMLINAILANKRYNKDSELLDKLFESVLNDVDKITKYTVNNNNVDEDEDDNETNKNRKNNIVGADQFILGLDSFRLLRGEMWSLVLLARVSLEELRINNENNRNENSTEIWNNNLATLAERVLSELRDEVLSFSKTRGLANVSLAFLRCGQLNEATAIAMLTETEAKKLTSRNHTIYTLVNLLPIYKSLNNTESLTRIKNHATELATSFISETVNVQLINVLWRTRDIELDRVMRKLVELDMLDDLLPLIENINEPIIYDRIVRTIVYIYLDKNNINAAESTAKKLRLPEYRFAATRDTNFIKNLTTKSENSENNANK
ncbi:MAG: hypothetical protein LBH59_00230 [Planctomycetaceae bacterium]|jgi:hypothetical protein|nr:hypothetical protein [Planctomycetaceae bacterium]